MYRIAEGCAAASFSRTLLSNRPAQREMPADPAGHIQPPLFFCVYVPEQRVSSSLSPRSFCNWQTKVGMKPVSYPLDAAHDPVALGLSARQAVPRLDRWGLATTDPVCLAGVPVVPRLFCRLQRERGGCTCGLTWFHLKTNV